MKVYIMTDIEGVAGVLNAEDWIYRDSRYLERGRALLAGEVNAAIRGLFDAGADEVVVVDGHGSGGINHELLDKRAEYSRGWHGIGIFGLDEGYDAILWVGQHAKAGSMRSHLAHTGGFGELEWRLNGTSIGEYGAIVYTAGFYGIPVIFASGERAFCDEVKELTPWAHTVEVKRGVTRDNGANCSAEEYENHNLGAVHLHPEVVRERIYEGAKKAMSEFIENPEKFKALCPEPPFTCERWHRRKNGNPAYKTIMKNRADVADAIYGTPDEILYEGAYEPPYPYIVEEK